MQALATRNIISQTVNRKPQRGQLEKIRPQATWKMNEIPTLLWIIALSNTWWQSFAVIHFIFVLVPLLLFIQQATRVTHQKHGSWKWLTAFWTPWKLQYFPSQLKDFWTRSPTETSLLSLANHDCHFSLCGCPTRTQNVCANDAGNIGFSW